MAHTNFQVFFLNSGSNGRNFRFGTQGRYRLISLKFTPEILSLKKKFETKFIMSKASFSVARPKQSKKYYYYYYY